jgi:hypothetical protein
MKYTVKLDGQYLKFNFDRQVSNETIYRSWTMPGSVIGPKGGVKEKDLCDAIAHTPGVLRSTNNSCVDGVEHIMLQGAEVSVKIITIGNNVREIANQIVKKIQRRFAKGEGRKRVKAKDLAAIETNFNKNY